MSVRPPAVAKPRLSVLTVASPTIAPPVDGVKVTSRSITRLPYWSCTRTRGATATAVPASACCASPASTVSVAATSATPIAVIVAVGIPVADTVRVFSPASVASVHSAGSVA